MRQLTLMPDQSGKTPNGIGEKLERVLVVGEQRITRFACHIARFRTVVTRGGALKSLLFRPDRHVPDAGAPAEHPWSLCTSAPAPPVPTRPTEM